MRQGGQQNRRGRNRNNGNTSGNQSGNGNRKGQNPLTRNFNSSGPEMKIHGTPNYIADKYVSAARDALSSGDPVLAENYLQHAEHYNRIILAVREQQIQQGDLNSGPRPRPVLLNDGSEPDGYEEDTDQTDTTAVPHGQMAVQPGGQSGGQSGRGLDATQPTFEQQRFDDRPPRVQNEARPPRMQGEPRQYRGDHEPRRDRMDRGEPRADRPDVRSDQRGDRDRPEFERDRSDRDRGHRGDRGFVPERTPDRAPDHLASDRSPAFQSQPFVETGTPGTPGPRSDAPRRRERFNAAPPAAHEQPEFLRRPVRRPRRDANADQSEAEPLPPLAVPGTDDPSHEG